MLKMLEPHQVEIIKSFLCKMENVVDEMPANYNNYLISEYDIDLENEVKQLENIFN